ncbi:Opioid growth factor receptor-like protein 1 [Heterocephalus glaber]|uniref:Opioid growth factor receptor-like protein 1 n=1 Tax=Heterocephalus glaber TaxID=10181 RepID=G5ALY8_HETGA|nr:Opioid growth factor receptor-like protein 1 [Heterocephalus glaber]
MGNLLGGVGLREPTTVEDCDSTWQTDSEPEPEPEERGSPARDAEAAGAGQDGFRSPVVTPDTGYGFDLKCAPKPMCLEDDWIMRV